MFPSTEKPLYSQIVSWIRQEIQEGRLVPGDRLPSIRQLTHQWNCTPGTVQHAYAELSRQGLVVSRSGQGTHVIKELNTTKEDPLRRAALIHQAESFLLESITAGYYPEEIEAAIGMAADRWRIIQNSESHPEAGVLRFAGSHDPALTWLAVHFPEIIPRFRLQIGFNGSLGGLIALAEGQADLAGSHLWDEETDTYNVPYVRRLLPGRQAALLTLAHRRLGLIVPPGNPENVHGLADLLRPEIDFVNRQPGSGTRVWLDAHLRLGGISAQDIPGYHNEKMTHTDVAAAIAMGQANLGFGLETAAITFDLDYIHLVQERYDLVIPAENLTLAPIESLANWLQSSAARQAFESLGGYDTTETGKLTWV
jgi:molybdate-binding protein/DNA-binding transcriptional regulator YhcF (GntR family)